MRSSAQHALVYIAERVSSPVVLGGTLLCLPAGHDRAIVRRLPWAAVLTPLWLFGLVFLSFAPVYWGRGQAPVERVYSAISFAFLLGWFCLTVPALRTVAWVDRLARRRSKVLSVLGGLILLGGVAWEGHTWRAADDLLSGRAMAYSNQREERLTRIRLAREAGVSSLAVPRLTRIPGILCFVDLPSDRTVWINQDCARFYGLEAIWTYEDHEPPPKACGDTKED